MKKKNAIRLIVTAVAVIGFLCIAQDYNMENRSNVVSGALKAGMGADLSSGATITPTNLIHRVTGTGAIATITTPAGIKGGQMLILIPKGLLSTTIVGGNVGLASTAIVDKALILVWDSTDSKWKPTY